MTLEQYLKERAKTDAAAEKLVREMAAFQERLLKRVSDGFATLDTVGGKLIPSEENIARAMEIIQEIENNLSDDQWTEAVADYIESYDVATNAAMDYFGTIGPAMDAALLDTMKEQFQKIMAEYLMEGSSFRAVLTIPLARDASGYIAGSAPVKDLLDIAANTITGGAESEGALVGTSGTTIKSTQIVYERNATQVAADEIGAEFFLFQGRKIDTTRSFCRARAGKYFHRKEIEEWADLEWDGKVDGTDRRTIFVHLGGWYGKGNACRHVLVPVSRRQVPREDLDRMREKGLIS